MKIDMRGFSKPTVIAALVISALLSALTNLYLMPSVIVFIWNHFNKANEITFLMGFFVHTICVTIAQVFRQFNIVINKLNEQ